MVGVARSFDTGERFRVLRCRSHGVELADAPTPSFDVGDKTRSMSAKHNLAVNERARVGRFLDVVEAVVPGRGTLYDVGCGLGFLLSVAAERGWEVRGNDLNPMLVEWVRAAGYLCDVGQLVNVDVSPASCDVVTSYCVLPNHIAEPNPALRAVYSMLRPGGWFALELPTNGIYRKVAKALYAVSGRRWSWVLSHFYVPDGHPLAYNPRAIELHLRHMGFDNIQVRRFRQSPSYTTARLQTMAGWKRYPIMAAVYAAHWVSRLPGQANHMIVLARRPPR